jgi:hypothetical protein
MDGTCSVVGCDRNPCAKSFCNMHWKRWRKTGDPGPAGTVKRSACSIADCAGKHYGLGYCEKHYQRVMKYGDPQVVMPNGNWRGDDARYQGVHARLYRQRGRADGHRCAHCERGARDWAYDYSPDDPHVKYEAGRPFSVDLNRYMPLCASCHKKHDLAMVT